ncbi:unnamed protein product [Acanthoscelides obtectus]|uniref:Uncharacterized protein n=1 Tax=Acanthoscelides obtectus TaxID=200917 RepID=A0A9P0L3D1_ACAOB|nr:unnamed protein product [Acanthoscelides obtectus]CAK1672467.1 hypothetical protein AOBTE_LOCUS28915 [Acanthoscelides obtectus]
MESYEKEQQELEKYWQEILSEEESDESLLGDTYLSDEYQPSDSSDSEYESSAPERNQKRKRVAGNTKSLEQDVPVASTSKKQEYTNFEEHVDAAIESVIAQHSKDSEEEILGEPKVSNAVNEAIVWGPVNGENLQKFTFEDHDSAGFDAQLYENFYNKSAFEFYEHFVGDGLLSMMVSV